MATIKTINTNAASGAVKRFGNTLLATQILTIACAVNAYFLGNDYLGQDNLLFLYGIRIDVILFSICAFLFVPLLRTLSQRNLEKANRYYFFLLAGLTVVLAILEGGLHSVPVMCFPIIAIFSALRTERTVFFSICLFFIAAVVFMAVNHQFGWFEGMLTSGTARMIDMLILLIISAYLAWVLGKESKKSISELKRKHQDVIQSKVRIQELADTDPLTKLANRSFAKKQFESMQASMDPNSEEIVLYFVDLDNFKTINDLFDHEMGDELLRIIAKRLSRIIESKGIVCRLGGDEFAIFLKVKTPFAYDALADEILIAMSEKHILLGAQAEISASLGVTIIRDQVISFDNARKQADMAMFKSKQSGKNGYHYYSEDLQRDYMKNLMVLKALKDALNRQLFDLYYQPKVNIKSNQVVGVEALLRWTRENPNQLTPGDFIPVIESTELIHEIGAWVIEEACMACKEWHQHGHKITVAVNVSALQLARSGFYKTVTESLSGAGLSAKYLEIEITEHFLIQENALITNQLNDLKKLGIKIAIDDFGTGYSNMGYLTRMSVDTLKLDRSFISGIDGPSNSMAIVIAINGMAKVLGMSVVAEGIETEAERLILDGIDCPIGQGYLWSKALPHKELLSYLN